MATSNLITHFSPAPSSHSGTTISSLMEMVESVLPSARPLMSVADLRILLRVELRALEGGQ